MLTIGPDVQEISSAYDEYWNSDLSFPGTAMSEDASLEEFQSRREDLKEYLNQNKEILASYPPDPLNLLGSEKDFKFSKNEISKLIVVSLIMGVILSFRKWGETTLDYNTGIENLINVVNIIVLFTVHCS